MGLSGGSCAFFAPAKGSDRMNNQEFKQKSTGEKQRYLAAILKEAANGNLDDNMIEWILSVVYIHRQYAVAAYSDDKAFRQAVGAAQAGDAMASVVSVQAANGTVASVITPQKTGDGIKSNRAIFIYSPKLHLQEGEKNAQGLQGTHSVRSADDPGGAGPHLPDYKAMAPAVPCYPGHTDRRTQAAVRVS